MQIILVWAPTLPFHNSNLVCGMNESSQFDEEQASLNRPGHYPIGCYSRLGKITPIDPNPNPVYNPYTR